MALNFPSTVGQPTDGTFTFTSGEVTWIWDGITWKSKTEQNESDPVFLASPAGLISSQDVTEWNTAYGWGDHSLAGYVGGSGGSMDELVDDTTPQLGGILDCNGFSIDFGTNIITDAGVANYNTAYGWGDHSQAGYLTSYTETDPVFAASDAAAVTAAKISNWDTAYGWGDHSQAGYLTSYTETDPVFAASDAAAVTAAKISNWDTAYGWGNHASAGYLTSYTETQTLDNVLALGATTTRDITTTGKVYFSNNFTTTGDLPNATTYHGMFAHVHAEGHGYFAHAGAWTQLLDTGSNISELADVSNNSPSTNDVLTWNGSTWIPAAAQGGSGGGATLGSRQIFSGSTSNSHANNASQNLTIAAYKGYVLYKVKVSQPAWVTLYVSSATRISDISRLITEDPSPGSGILAEAITQSSSETVLFTPALIGYNDDSTPTTNIYLKVVNKSGFTQSINVEITVTQLEV